MFDGRSVPARLNQYMLLQQRACYGRERLSGFGHLAYQLSFLTAYRFTRGGKKSLCPPPTKLLGTDLPFTPSTIPVGQHANLLCS